jgi:hypothetical protein
VVNATLRRLYRPVPIAREAGLATGPVWREIEKGNVLPPSGFEYWTFQLERGHNTNFAVAALKFISCRKKKL